MPSKATRVAVLLLLLAVAALWAVNRTRARRARTSWDQPVAVAVLVLQAGGPPAARAPADGAARLRASLEALGVRLSEERRRHAPGSPGPAVTIDLFGPLEPGRLPPVEAPRDGAVARVLHAVDLWRAGRAAHAAAQAAGTAFDPAAYDVRVYLVASGEAAAFAEGLGEAGGEVGVVRAGLGGDGLLAATAVLHEAFHCLGATDKYDARGHAVAPGGLAEPELAPPYPQRMAEIMVGEVPLGPGQGRLPASAAELGVGPVTAAEIGWLPRDAAP